MTVKEFLQTHLDELDDELWFDFFLSAHNLLSPNNITELVSYLTKAGIDFEYGRDKTLDYLILRAIEDIQMDMEHGTEKTILLSTFVSLKLVDTLGKDKRLVMEYLRANASEFGVNITAIDGWWYMVITA